MIAEGTDPRAVGVVLAGGAARRMGRDKARLELGGEPLARSAARRLAAVTGEVLVAGRGRAAEPSFPSVPDGPGAGPAAGILGAAAARPGRPLLVLACDLPAVPPSLLAALAGRSGDWVVPRHGERLEPLCALYRPPALAALLAAVSAGDNALHPLAAVPGLAVTYLEGADLRAFGNPARLFLNLNRPSDV